MAPAPDRGLRFVPSSLLHPNGLALFEKEAIDPSDGVLLCVHGSLDRARSFARLARRLPHLDVLAADRRGYQGSRDVGASSNLDDHVGDLLAMVSLVADRGPITLLGHSLGGVIALRAALDAPSVFSGLVLYEVPLRWLLPDEPDWWLPAGDDALDAERFFRLLTSDGAWDRLSHDDQAERQADGPALVADLTMVRADVPFALDQLAQLAVPVAIATGGASDNPRYAQSAALVAGAAPDATISVVRGAPHGAHLSHPDGLAALVTEVLTREQATARAVR